MDDNIASRILSPLVFLCELMSMYLSTKVGFFTLKTDKQSATAKTLLSNIKQCVELSALNTKRYEFLNIPSFIWCYYQWLYLNPQYCSYFANFVKNIPDLQGSISRDFDVRCCRYHDSHILLPYHPLLYYYIIRRYLLFYHPLLVGIYLAQRMFRCCI